MAKYGLFGRDIGYSFSRNYFKLKFERDHIGATYDNFDCDTIEAVQAYLDDTEILGFNVTIPYKEAIIPLLDGLDEHSQNIGAVNTIKRESDGRLIGYNTDFVGFKKSLLEQFGASLFNPFLKDKVSLGAKVRQPLKALILGTGGASKGVLYALKSLGVRCQRISRKRTNENLTYSDIDQSCLNETTFIVNCTPLGTYPDIALYPDIPYSFLNSSHVAYDLIYNPPESRFLQLAKAQKATTINGLRMLELQAEASWNIWNTP